MDSDQFDALRHAFIDNGFINFIREVDLEFLYVSELEGLTATSVSDLSSVSDRFSAERLFWTQLLIEFLSRERDLRKRIDELASEIDIGRIILRSPAAELRPPRPTEIPSDDRVYGPQQTLIISRLVASTISAVANRRPESYRGPSLE